MSIVKNQHYVPRAYLRRFADSEERLFVFDKSNGKCFPSHIKNIACEKYFYDISEKHIQANADIQAVEKYLSTIETHIAPFRDAILGLADAGEPFSATQKAEFADYLLLQLLRTKTQREQYSQMNQMLEFIAEGNQELLDRYRIPDDQLSLEHARIMFSPAALLPMKQALMSHIWFIGMNETDKSIYTSDSPVVRYPHVRNPLMGTNGLACSGIEIDFPLSPRHILIIAERSFHKDLMPLDFTQLRITDVRCILHLNSLQVQEAYRQVYSDQDDFEHAMEYLRQFPEAANIDRPRVEMVSPRRTGKQAPEPRDKGDEQQSPKER